MKVSELDYAQSILWNGERYHLVRKFKDIFVFRHSEGSNLIELRLDTEVELDNFSMENEGHTFIDNDKTVVEDRCFQTVSTQQNKEDIYLPLRATRTSAGYDFFAVQDLYIKPGKTAKFWTDIKVYLQPDEVLLMVPRSSIGIKRDLMLANTVGVIDSDYYNNPDNEGNIAICLRNLKDSIQYSGDGLINVMGLNNVPVELRIPIIKDLTEANTVFIPKGDRVVQGIIVNYLESDNCNCKEERSGGIGSTSK